jgi:polar amino acid transport system substrate-binding protein
MKKVISIILVALMMATVLTACASKAPAPAPQASETPNVDRIKAAGVLILGTESTYPPFEFIVIENGKSVGVGLDVDLAKLVAEKLGVELQTSEMAFDSLIPSLQAGTIDIAGSMTPTDERKLVIDFSDLYYGSTNTFVVAKADEAAYGAKDSFKGKTIGAQMGTVQNTLVVEEFGESENLILPKVSTLIQELKTGNIDAICLEEPVADCYVSAMPNDLAVAGFSIPDEGGGVAFTMAKGAEDLAAVINEVLKEAMADGTVEELYNYNIELAKDQIVND